MPEIPPLQELNKWETLVFRQFWIDVFPYQHVLKNLTFGGKEFILIKSKISFRDRHKINCFLHQKSTWADTEIQHFSEQVMRLNLLHQTPPKFIGRNLTFETQLMMQFLFHIMTSFEWTEIKQTQLYFSQNVPVICNLR